MTEIVSPGSKIVFLENGDDRGWLMGSWLMDYEDPHWIDPFAIWHGDFSSLGFADGHAENHRWVDDSTINNVLANPMVNDPTAPNDNDIRYMQMHYVAGNR